MLVNRFNGLHAFNYCLRGGWKTVKTVSQDSIYFHLNPKLKLGENESSESTNTNKR